MTDRTRTQAFCCKIQYPGKRPILYGTAVCDAGAPHHEIAAALKAQATECIPDGFDVVEVIPGAIFFGQEGEPWTP